MNACVVGQENPSKLSIIYFSLKLKKWSRWKKSLKTKMGTNFYVNVEAQENPSKPSNYIFLAASFSDHFTY